MQALSPPAVGCPSPSASCHHGRGTKSPLAEPKFLWWWQQQQQQLHGLSGVRGRRVAAVWLVVAMWAWWIAASLAPHGTLRERGGMRGHGQCQHCCCYFCQCDSPSRVLTSLLACQGLPQGCRELPMAPGTQQEVQHAAAPWDPSCGCTWSAGASPGAMEGSPQAPVNLWYLKQLEKQPRSSLCPAGAALPRVEWGWSEPPMAHLGWQ